MKTDLFVLTFESPTGADAMLQNLKALQDDNFIELLDAVIVTKDLSGKVQIRQPLAVGPGKGAAVGAVEGAIIGLLAGPGGALVGLVSGAITGAATGAAMEAGLPQDDIKALAVDELEPGDSALLVYVDEVWIDQIEDAARNLAANVARHVVDVKQQAARDKAARVRKEKIDTAYKAWQSKVDDARQSVTALRQQTINALKSDQAAVHSQLDSADAKLQGIYKNIIQTLLAWKHQVDADIHELEDEGKQANAEAKADVQRRLATAKEARAAARAHVKETLTARLNAMKSDIDSRRAQAVTAQGQAKDRLNQEVAKLQAEWDADQKRLDQLDTADGAAWDKLVTSIDDAFNAYGTSLAEAEIEYEK